MTLINYLNRAHFADNILEEAVWAELDSRSDAPVCILTSRSHHQGEIGERLRAGLPRRMRTVDCIVTDAVPTEAEARAVRDRYAEAGAAAILAYGPGAVINLAKAVRLMVSHATPLAQFSETEGGRLRITGAMPDLIAVPSMRGVFAGFNGLLSVLLDKGVMIDIASRDLVPTVTIADPTVALSEPAEVRATAGVGAMTICTEALLSPNFNPPAKGIANDGLSRCVRFLNAATADGGIDNLREVVAACMNAAMVQQKGLGPIHAMTYALCTQTGHWPDKGAVRRILLPAVVRAIAAKAPLGCEALTRSLGCSAPEKIADTLDEVLRRLPLPARLADLGLTADALGGAAALAAGHRALANSPFRLDEAEIANILHTVL